jgi:type IV pilus assembly protein PilB
MARHRQVLGELLIAQRIITREQLEAALEIQRQNPAPLGKILVQCGYITQALVVKALSAQMGVGPWFLSEEPPTLEVIHLIPLEICKKHDFIPVQLTGNLLTLAMKNPLDIQAIDLARNWTKFRIETVFVDNDDFDNLIAKLDSTENKFEGMDGLVSQAIRDFGSKGSQVRAKSMLTEEDVRPVIGVVNQILSEAVRLGSSDVHLEPSSTKLGVRYRVDGQLRKVLDFPMEMLPMIAVRLKIMADLDVVEHRIPQDGRINASVDGRDIDLRVSVQPGYHGPRIVLRILDKAVSLRDLSELGFGESNQARFKSFIRKPHGLVLVTGPTGSGKTTTLYAALKAMRNDAKNIMTCEDPVEYEIEGISQASTHDKVGLDFANLLRSCLRQDPDMILVGEIRDKETVQTAVRAAMTGHLVLSTLHCNDAPNAIPRLIDLGIDPYMLSTCLAGVTAQRLVRRLCPDCRVPSSNPKVSQFVSEALGIDGAVLFEEKGCGRCSKTGFRGRVGVHEAMPINDEIGNAIANQVPLVEVVRAAKATGFEPMIVDALRKVVLGETSISEVQRVIGIEDVDFDEAVFESMRQAA